MSGNKSEEVDLAVRGKSFEEVEAHADEIARIARDNGFSDVRYVYYHDPAYHVTLLMSPREETSLFDAGAVMDEIESSLGWRVMLVTPDEYATSKETAATRPLWRVA